MTSETHGSDCDRLRRDVRRRALANLIVVLLAQAQRSAGRLTVQPFTRDALLLGFSDVRTLVGRTVMDLEPRDFAVVLACPPAWPIDRAATLQPFVLAPNDFRHPNANGHLCLDLAGVAPEVLPGLLYDNLRLARFRLDHCMDLAAADYVRAHRERFPSDERSLFRGEEAP